MNIQKQYYYVQPLEKLNRLSKRQEEINYNGLMTPHEKQTARERVQLEKQGMYNQVVNVLDLDWRTLKQEYQDLRREKTAAADRSEKKWDFQRLEYGRKAARDFISSADPGAIAKRYNEIELSGDTHALRGFVEEGLSVLNHGRTFTKEDVGTVVSLVNDFRKMRDDLTVTKEMRDLAKQGEILTGKIRDVSQATDRVRGEYFKVDAMGTDDNPFDKMRQGVHISQHVDNNLALITEVDLDWE